ncbi:MAG: OstA-like protein [Candidatus Firestonebacteria bacterium]
MVAVPIFVSILNAQELKVTQKEPLEITAKLVLGNNKTKEIVYMKDVVLKHAGNILKSDKLTILPNNDKIIAEDNVSFVNKNNTMEMKGEYVEYFKSNKYVVMRKSPVLLLTDSEGIKTTVKSDVVELFSEEEKAVVSGNVEMIKEDIKILCGQANYDKSLEKIVLEGKPVVFKKQDKYEGDKITIFTKKRNLIADSNVKALIYFEEKKQ